MLIRHAKAEANAPTDEERPLAARGHADAEAAGQWLSELGISLDTVVVSPARRAQETWAEISQHVSAETVIEDERIYENTVDDLLAILTDLPGGTGSIALVGHNPSMHALAYALDDGKGDPEARAEIAGSYPTCGIALFDVPVSWSDLAPGTATLFTFAAPRG